MEEDTLLETGCENTYSFKSMWEKCTTVEDFLRRSDHIPVRGTTISESEYELWLNCTCDIDGVSIEWRRLSGTTHVFHHLYLAPRGLTSLKKMYPMMKKHVNLRAHGENSLKLLKSCVGTQIFYDSGWEYYLCLLPEVRCSIRYDDGVIRGLTLNWIQEVRVNMQRALNRCLGTREIRGTLDKNNLNDARKLFILPGDSPFVLKLFDECVAETQPPQHFTRCVYSFRFGEKNREGVALPIGEGPCVSRICVHSAVDIELADDEDAGLFWSRYGIRSVTGRRGALTSAMSFAECSNFQSSLDGRLMDVSNDLRSVCAFPERAHFVQLYADLPHRYPDTRFHPVSAAILIGTGLRSHTKYLDSDAETYLSEVDSNFRKIQKSTCRLEFVLSLQEVGLLLQPKDFINVDRLKALLAKHPMVVPFIGDEVTGYLRDIGSFLSNGLRQLNVSYNGSGQSEAVWQAYQYELAVEKMLWGTPLCRRSTQNAVNLGIGVAWPSRSLTDQRGFLCLANKFACCADEDSCPPLAIYNQSEVVQKQVKKMFGFQDYLDGSPLVLGRRLVLVLMEDFYDVGAVRDSFSGFFARLKRVECNMRVIGRASVQQIADILCDSALWKAPMISQHLLAALKKKGKDVTDILLQGIQHTGVKYFPAVRKSDTSANSYLNWNLGYGVWFITCEGKDVPCAEKAGMMCPLIVTELENRHLCYTSRLLGTREAFPWVLPCLEKLQCCNLSDRQLVETLTFVTCVAFLQNGRYVDFNRLGRLEMDMSLSQKDLRRLEIQGKFLLPTVKTLKVWRLHETIPGLSAAKPVQASTSTQVQARPVQPTLELREDDHPRISAELDVAVSSVDVPETGMHLANGVRSVWSPQELQIIGHVTEGTNRNRTAIDMYRQYVEECRKAGIPDRSFQAFRRKIRRTEIYDP